MSLAVSFIRMAGQSERPRQADRHRDHSQVHRSQLHHQERAGDGARLSVLPAPRTERGPRGAQRTHQHGRQLLESPVHPRADLPRRIRTHEAGPGGRTLDQCLHIDRSAEGHAVMVFRSVPSATVPIQLGRWATFASRMPASERTVRRYRHVTRPGLGARRADAVA